MNCLEKTLTCDKSSLIFGLSACIVQVNNRPVWDSVVIQPRGEFLFRVELKTVHQEKI